MSMSIPKSGFARFLKEGAMHFKGMEEAVKRNIEACVELSSQLRSAYGPNGMNKMIINRLEKLFITSDAVTILNELEIQHPAVKLIVMAAQMQQKQIGDNTNSVVIFAGSLLEQASQLLDMGLNAAEIALGFDQAFEEVCKILPNLVATKAEDLYDVTKVQNYLKSSIASKYSINCDLISELVAKACVQIVPKNAFNFNVDNIRICKIIGSGIASSTVMNGMVFKRSAEGEIKKVSDAKVAVFASPFDLTQTETKGTVLMNTADDLLKFSGTEESEVERQVKALHQSGVNVVVAAGKFGDLYLHFLNKYKIMGVRLTSKFDLRRLCIALGAQAQSRICAPDPKAIGQCDQVYVKEIGDSQVMIFDKHGESGKIATIIIRGSSQSLLDDVERAIDDGINTYKVLTRDNRLLPGGGATEVELSQQIEAIGEKCSGLQQYAIKKFATALEVFPKQLAQNAGLNPTETLYNLYPAHKKGNPNFGIDVISGKTVDVAETGIFDLFSSKLLAVKLATNAASTVLRIDQIIMAKPAGGPAPRPPGALDQEDD